MTPNELRYVEYALGKIKDMVRGKHGCYNTARDITIATELLSLVCYVLGAKAIYEDEHVVRAYQGVVKALERLRRVSDRYPEGVQ